ncbi:trehalose synthase [Solidesulfovibrio carbinoliphilus subsp. oakridgensis]|uniref:maltose alpha-D-glucosyltransferase n=1 Tax=Solidesulfovibrio carbinoliphilus subsp. oakridgensis TaxID=694327 RepID=G7Q9Q4_9BACT|nr:maltose alpha-D-glucosyltransferase [Solidesulfovibrio carbinoliphilus]EHJ49170.1 trehalose synthase [Solidesulfovibrio carbinoliphilus subsp. oakridgensis]
MSPMRFPGDDDPLWYKDAVIYEVHVKAFMDGNGDGIGDFAGLTSRLDYLANLGVDTLWLLPFYPSPLRDDGYDIADYYGIHPHYGTLRDFKDFLREAHDRGLKVITELVVNHTSDQHPWFKRSRVAPPGDPWRDYYVWSKTPDKYRQARIIFKDFEHSNWTFDQEAGAYYWHRFYSHQPDLNYDNPRVRKDITKVMDFWLSLGVDGLRLDAVPYLYERRGTNCENLPETHGFLKKLRAHVDTRFKNRMLLAEANQWPEDAVAYFGDGDECHMAYHFPIMPRIYMALMMEDRFPILDIMEQTPAIAPTCQWAMFLRNHDELTLEMVSDEERDYMYKVYATDRQARINLGIRRRLAPLMQGSRRRMELINFLLLSFPGTPIIYYGDEIGMGDNFHLGDRDGVRTPMQWSPDKNAGFSSANPQNLYLPAVIDPQYHYLAVNVENQEANLSSFLWWMRRMIALRRRLPVMGRGDMVFLNAENSKVLAFTRSYEGEVILVVVNLSRFSQMAAIDLAAFAGITPVDAFSGTRFPPVTAAPYVLPLSRHDYYWLRLARGEEQARDTASAAIPRLDLSLGLKSLLGPTQRKALAEEALPPYARRMGPAGPPLAGARRVVILDAVPVGPRGLTAWLLLLEIQTLTGESRVASFVLALATGEEAAAIERDSPRDVVAQVSHAGREGTLVTGFAMPGLRAWWPEAVFRKARLRGADGVLVALPEPGYARTPCRDGACPSSRMVREGQSNIGLEYNGELYFKFYGTLDGGPHPEAEMLRYLSGEGGFPQTPKLAGVVEYRPKGGGEAITVATVQEYVAGARQGLDFTLEHLERYFEQRRALPDRPQGPEEASGSGDGSPDMARSMAGMADEFYLEMARLLGRRTAQMHLALARGQGAFAPEPFTKLYQRSVYQAIRNRIRRATAQLARSLPSLPPEWREAGALAVGWETPSLQAIAGLLTASVETVKIRIHGELRLENLLFTGKDFLVVDFEGDPRRPVGERRLKRSALRDVASLFYSFYAAGEAGVGRHKEAHPEDAERAGGWAWPWAEAVSRAFFGAYAAEAGDSPILPGRREMLLLLKSFLLEEAYNALALALAMDGRPERIGAPLSCIRLVLELK